MSTKTIYFFCTGPIVVQTLSLVSERWPGLRCRRVVLDSAERWGGEKAPRARVCLSGCG